MPDQNKCQVRDGLFVDPCRTLEDNTDNPIPGFSKVKGIANWSLHNIKTGEPSRAYWGVKSKNHPNGFLFNYCPFCGQDISAPFQPKEDGQDD